MSSFRSPVNTVEKPNEADGVYRPRKRFAELLHVPELLVLLFPLLFRALCAHLPAGESLPSETKHLLVAGAEKADVVKLCSVRDCSSQLVIRGSYHLSEETSGISATTEA